jgi:hypothetical protein
MPRYEYKVVPAPTKGVKGEGIKGADARVAHALELVMNELGAEGWEYIRADTLPFEERTRLTRVETKYKNLLVFRRSIDGEIRTWPAAQTATVAASIAKPVGPAVEAERPAVVLRSVETPKPGKEENDDSAETDEKKD